MRSVDRFARTIEPTPRPGAGRLAFAFERGTTHVRASFSTSPLKLLHPRDGDACATAWLSTLGGGLLGGDEIALSIALDAGATAALLTQASTKVYRSDRIATQRIDATIGAGALLVSAPDPLVCFAGAAFAQTQRFQLDSRGSVVALDWLVSGRHAVGERWQFRSWRSELVVERAGRRILRDVALLDPVDGVIADRLGARDVFGTLLLAGPRLAEASRTLLAAIASLPVKRGADPIVSASPCAEDGVLVRFAARDVAVARALVSDWIGLCAPAIGHHPWSRRW